MKYDVIVVGARCAGATLAALLARSGVKTLLLDAQAMHSDMPLSTHFIQPPGMDVLDEIGVGSAVRARAPVTRRVLLRMEKQDVFFNYEHKRLPYCVRRSIVDPLVQDAAMNAGAEFRDRTRVVELIKDGERVSGVVTESDRGRETLHAGLVVGADGRNSTVARLASAEQYLTLHSTRSVYWFYFPASAIWREHPDYAAWDACIAFEGDGVRYIFQCDGDELMMAASPPVAEFLSWQGDYQVRALEYLRGSSLTRPLVEATAPEGKGIGMARIEFFLRRAAGPGYALVGDAGIFKDPITGNGMTDAYLAAKWLHTAILRGSDAALEYYWRERDARFMPWYLDAYRLGEVGVNNPFTQLLFEHLAGSRDLAARQIAVADRQISPLEVFSLPELLRMVGGAVLRGRTDVVRPFLQTAKKIQGFRREAALRQRIMRECA